MDPIQGSHEHPPEEKLFSRSESSQSSLEGEDEGTGEEFSEDDVRRGHSIELKSVIGTARNKSFVKKQKAISNCSKDKKLCKGIRIQK